MTAERRGGGQVIPRPPQWRLGRRAGWELGETEVATVALRQVVEGLRRVGTLGPLTVDPVEYARTLDPVLCGLVPEHRIRRSAVLCALFEEQGQARVILTRRSSSLRLHRGEVAFPGGRLDHGEDEWSAALREAEEEVGLSPSDVRLVGWLSPIVTVVSGSFIAPFVGVLAERPTLRAAPDEVERIFDVALADLLVPGVFHEERWVRGDRPMPSSEDGSFPIFFFEVAGETIWGATARMLYQLLHLALGLDPVIA